ncbi:EamA family transporter [Nesterenkonia xinjiangensis]|uniref:Drug/metabolite transporter (DMT)-like permease n=1 Tax=Nesterenkonia xinjiangensis TaxID=225327 RepID=A0A7Z0GLX1_9MICC|nr:drug/metabolite transporter (DMT)-like permease [Nesterenkonia xinjiangensis]
MSTEALALVLTAAVFHATWNLAAKTSRGDTTVFVWLYFSLGGLLCLPVGLVQMLRTSASYGWELPGAALFTALLHVGYAMLLQTGYRRADLGVVYPVARGVGPVLTMVIAVGLLGERPETSALLGGLVVIGGILIVAGRRLFGGGKRVSAGLFYGTATGIAIAAYTVWDSFSMTRLDLEPILYFALSSVFQSLVMLPWVLRRRALIPATWRIDHRLVGIIGVLSPLAYILVLYAMTTTPVALVAPVRESSIVIGALLAWWLFKEPDPVRRVLGAVVVCAGVALIAG